MDDLSKLASRMRSDWDRRVSHDYRFWMSDGHSDDKAMWESGERDFNILTAGISNPEKKIILEVGCGVGRLLRAASEQFKKVIGFDVSGKAILKADELLFDRDNVDLYQGNGFDLQPIPDKSLDVVVSFAALTSMPTRVIAAYLCEMHRVLKPGGEVRLQVYLGEENKVSESDTLHLRCYKQNNFFEAVKLAGFTLESHKELILPFEVSFKEIGIEAIIVSMNKGDLEPGSAEAIAQKLLPEGESMSEEESPDGLEYWMTLSYAKELVKEDKLDKARETLQYALDHSTAVKMDVQDLLQKIVAEVRPEGRSSSEVTAEMAPASDRKSALLENNLAVVKQRFPQCYETLTNYDWTGVPVECKVSEQGPILFLEEQCLDHPTKPLQAGIRWAQQRLREHKLEGTSDILIAGFGSGYHVEALAELSGTGISVIEPEPAVLLQALSTRDLRDVLSRINNLHAGEVTQASFIGGCTALDIRPQTEAVRSNACSKIKSVFYGKRGVLSLNPTIAVLGPIQGGTLPIMHYTARALSGLKQRVKTWDVSSFAEAYSAFEKFIPNKLKRAPVEKSYVEMISEMLLTAEKEKPIDILICMAQAPISPEALTELRERGTTTVLWFQEDYLRFTYWKQMASYYDFVFTIQDGKCLSEIKAAGAKHVYPLAVACDPEVHAPQQLSPAEKERWGSPVSFVGAGYYNRQQTFASLANLPLKIWGTEWPTCSPFDRLVQENGRRLTPAEYIKIFNASDININLHSSREKDGVDPAGDFLNPRTFELASAGAFQLVDARSHLARAFEPGKEIAVFRDTEELKTKIEYYLQHPEERKAIAMAGQQRVWREHTYQHRLNEMLSLIYSSDYEKLKKRQAGSRWSKVLNRSQKDPELHERCERAFKRGEEANLDGLISDIMSGKGQLSETEKKLLFLYHIKDQIRSMNRQISGES